MRIAAAAALTVPALATADSVPSIPGDPPAGAPDMGTNPGTPNPGTPAGTLDPGTPAGTR
ncbi:hypothetical protein [Nocardia gipuzkoensis]